MERYKQLFFNMYNDDKLPIIITYFNHLSVKKLLQQTIYNERPTILGRLYSGDFREIEAALVHLDIPYKLIKSRHPDIKQKYAIGRKLTVMEIHQLTAYFLNNRVSLLPVDADFSDTLAEFGEVYNMPILSKWLRLVKPVSTVDLDFHNFSGDVSEGSTYINSGYTSESSIQPSIFELKASCYKKITKDKYKSQILSIAEYTKDVPIILAVLSDNCELTFFNTNRSTGEVLFTNTIRLVASDNFSIEQSKYKGYPEEEYKTAKVCSYIAADPATESQKELFSKIYKQLTEYDISKT